MYNIAIIDDHRILLDGITGMLRTGTTYNVDAYHKASDFLEGLGRKKVYDLLITDIQMPDMNGIELITKLRRDHNDMRILVMSMLDSKDLLYNLLKIGISGYFLKGNDSTELARAVKKVLLNEEYFSRELREAVKMFRNGNEEELLSRRELEIATLISKGKTTNEIGEALYVSPYTVQTHRKNIFRKLEVHNTAELLKILSSKNLI